MSDIRDQHEHARKALQNEIQNLNKLKIDYSVFKKTPSEKMELDVVKSRYNENLRRLGFNPKKRMNADLEFLTGIKKLLGVPMI
jgi:hypothetical protein